MGLIPSQKHLTVLDPSLEAQRRSTFPGMAHFAGSGPDGRTCRECKLWNGCGDSVHYFAKKGIHGGAIKPRECAKYREMMWEIGSAVPYIAAACKYFVENPAPPSIVDRR